jgi:hypothetical protein
VAQGQSSDIRGQGHEYRVAPSALALRLSTLGAPIRGT